MAQLELQSRLTTEMAEVRIPVEDHDRQTRDIRLIADVVDSQDKQIQQNKQRNYDPLFIETYGGYEKGTVLTLANGLEVVAQEDGVNTNPNNDMTGWFIKTINSSQVKNPDGFNQLEINNKNKILDRIFVDLDKLVPSVDGQLDCSAAINQAIQDYSGLGVELRGNPNSIYLIRDTIDFRGSSDITLNFQNAILLDDVQGTIPESGGRGKHTFLIYNCNKIKIKKLRYNIKPTRTNTSTSSIPTIVFWIGGQYLGGEYTSNIEIENFSADGHSIDQGMVVSGVGELSGLKLSRFSIKNGNWMFGCNFEYGLRPLDLESDLTLTNGRHPHDIYVEYFNGENLPKCVGFLRTASCYNVKFFSCITFNVPNFIYHYSGDRGISRYSQNVHYELCKSKLDDTFTFAQYAVQIIVTTKDGSTGEALESWVNRDHSIKFSQCEFIGNYTAFNTAVRYFGNEGKTIFEGCTFQRYYYGTWQQYTASTNPNTPSPSSLTFRDCIFKKNYADVYQIDTAGVVYDHCTFKSRVPNSIGKNQIYIDSILTGCAGTVFRDCRMSDQPTTNLIFCYVNSDEVYFERNTFALFDSSSTAITSTKLVYGSNNKCSTGLLTADSENFNRVIGDVRKLKVFNDTKSDDSLYFNVSNLWLINSTQIINQIIGGKVGDIVDILGGISASSATFNNSSALATTETRLINKSGVNDTLTGSTWTRRYIKTFSGWREI